MTRRRVRNTAAGLAAIAAFFAIVAFFAGFQRGQNMAYGASPDLFQDETPAPGYAPLTAQNGAQFRTCASEYGWGAHMNPMDDVFCHPRFTSQLQTPAPRVAAYEPAGRRLAPRAKPQRALDDAVASAIARTAGLSRTQTPSAPDALALALAPEPKQTKNYAPPTVPGGVGLTPLSPGFLNIGPNQEDPVGEDDPTIDPPDTTPPETTPPESTPPGDDTPPAETPDDEEPPEMPLPPLDPVDPDPVGPIDPTDPGDPTLPVDPTVVPIPGAVALWIPGLAGLILAARRRKRA